jgi:hypothetical protein
VSGSGGGASAAGCGDHIARRKRHAVGLSSRDTKFRDTGHAAAAPLACGRTGQGAAGTAPSGRRKSLFNAPRRGTREHTGDNVALAFGGSRPHVNGVPSFGALLPRLGPHVAAHFFVLLVGACSSSPAARPACAPAQVSCAGHGPCAGGHAICYRAPASCGLRLRGRRAMQNSNALESPLSHRCRAAWRDPSGGGAIIEQLSMVRKLHRTPCRRDGLPLHQSSPVHGDDAWHSRTLPSKCALSLGASAPTPCHLTSQKWCELFAKVDSSWAPGPPPG